MVLLEGGSCSRSAPLSWLPAAGGGDDPHHDGAVHPHPGSGRVNPCKQRLCPYTGTDRLSGHPPNPFDYGRGYPGPTVVLLRMCPNRAHSKPGPTVILLEGGQMLPIRSIVLASRCRRRQRSPP